MSDFDKTLRESCHVPVPLTMRELTDFQENERGGGCNATGMLGEGREFVGAANISLSSYVGREPASSSPVALKVIYIFFEER